MSALGFERSGATRFAQTVWEKTVVRVRQNWDAIEAVAEVLRAKGTLTGVEVARVVEAAHARASTAKRPS